MMCPTLLWMVDVWLDCGLVPAKGCQAPVECAGSSQPRCPPESCPGWPCLGRCQAPSPTRSARWVRPFGGRSGLPDTSPHSDSGAGSWGVLGPGQVNHHGRSWWGVRAVLQWAVRVCVCLCVCLGLVSSQDFPPPLPTLLASPSLPPGLVDFLPHPSLGPSIPRPPAVDVAWNYAAFMPLACAFKHFHIAPLVSITHGALQAFRCQKQDLKPTGRQVSAHPSSLTSVGGWLPKS